ncbi:MAG: hypothetical protein JNM66_07490 [Bryobacterales bacterium]|nr:hypothetical protein [Bryobacterales bacterium]
MEMRLTAASFGLALAAAILLLVWPVYSGFDGVRTTQATLLKVNGCWALVPVGFPVVVALLPLAFSKQALRIIATVLISGFSFISAFSVGPFYLPAAVTMLLAACVSPLRNSGKHSDADSGAPRRVWGNRIV